MISVEEYLATVVALAAPLPAVSLPLARCQGLTTAEPVIAELAVPPFDNSAMDGFAVRRAEAVAGARLPVDGDTPAGSIEVAPLAPGAARRIMTGAPIPAGADAVVPVENTDVPVGPGPVPSEVTIRVAPNPDAHIRLAGADLGAGERVLDAHTVLTPARLGAVASVGLGEVSVHRRPRVAVVTTGDELVEPGGAVRYGQIPDSNGLVMAALAAAEGAEVTAHRLSDDPAVVGPRLAEVAAGCDLVITAGGISAGAFDVVKQATTDVEYVQVAMQPGKPQGCGTVATPAGPVPLLALPGNPVSVYVSFAMFVRPFLAALAGRSDAPRRGRGVAAAGIVSPPNRRQYAPVRFVDDGRFVPVRRGGASSNMAVAVTQADAFAVIPPDVTAVVEGDELELVFL